MLTNQVTKGVWQASLLIAIVLCMTTSMDLTVIIGFTVISIALFLIDLWKNFKGLYRLTSFYRSVHAWNLISSMGQIVFWTYLMLFVFLLSQRSLLQWFLLVDLFVVATFMTYKFSLKLFETEEVLSHG